MKPDARHALLFALERGIAETDSQGKWHFYNASPIPDLSDDWQHTLVCEQAFRPEFLKLSTLGYSVTHQIDAGTKASGNAFFLLGRNRKWNEFQISRIWNSLQPGEIVVIAGAKTDGIGAIRKWFSSHAEVSDSLSKFHSVIFRASKKSGNHFPESEISQYVEGYYTQEGMFSSDSPDAGSKLLVEHFDNRIKGKVADLGAGWGFLSAALLKRTDHITNLDLFEADHASLEAAQRNVTPTTSTATSFNWIDVTTEFPKKPYGWIIMNPPFHSGRAAEPGLGQRFIEVAASTLPRGGRLLMVANKNLPYEQTLGKHFRSFQNLAEREGFKVIEALR